MSQRTMFEMSFQEWNSANGGSRAEWERASAAEWERIRSSLIASGHWHDGKSCAEVKCNPRAS